VVQNAEILAAGVKSEEDKKRRHISVQTITLLVSPNEAESLALGAHQGEVHLVLRNPVDQELMADSSTDTRRVLGLNKPRRRTRSVTPKPKPVEEKKVEVPVIEERKFTIIRNGTITEQTVPVKEPQVEPVESDTAEKSDK
jgi:pilus assembly protein CpaB